MVIRLLHRLTGGTCADRQRHATTAPAAATDNDVMGVDA